MGQHEGAVRAAMDRLFAGQAVHSDGRLTVKNLAVEAAIPRSTLCRAEPDLLRDFERRLHPAQDTAQAPRGGLAARVARLEAKLAATEGRAANYREELEQEPRRVRGLANQIALLDADGEAGRSTHGERNDRVPGRPPPAHPKRELIQASAPPGLGCDLTPFRRLAWTEAWPARQNVASKP